MGEEGGEEYRRRVAAAQAAFNARSSSEDESDDDGVPYRAPPRRRTRKPFPWKAAGTSLFLLFIGVVFGFTALGVGLEKGFSECLPFLIISGIGFIPGSYHTVIILRAWLGHRGYTYDLVPEFQ